MTRAHTTSERAHFRPGDRVEVLSLAEIAATLDAEDMLDGLPFMPEMRRFCGKTLRVSSRVHKTCVEGTPELIGGFPTDDLYLLDGARCGGESHGDCQRRCLLFWKARWLRAAGDGSASAEKTAGEPGVSDARFKTLRNDGRYHCQSTQLPRITRPLTRSRRLAACVRDARAGSYGWLAMLCLIVVPLGRKVLRFSGGIVLRGNRVKTPTESLDLQPGDVVRVKSRAEIRETLDHQGFNRGLEFSPDMAAYCGKTMTVLTRIDRMILEETGEMKHLHHTVMLDGPTCDCPLVVGGCPRREPHYWREIWLRKVSVHDTA